MGRPSIYSEELAIEFCKRVASGRAVKSVCDLDDDMPAWDTIFDWQRRRPDFSDLLAHARKVKGELYSDQIGVLSNRITQDTGLDPVRARVAIDGFEKAAKLHAAYVTRIEVSGPGGGPVRTEATAIEKLSDKELDDAERIARKLSDAGRDSGGAGAPSPRRRA